MFIFIEIISIMKLSWIRSFCAVSNFIMSFISFHIAFIVFVIPDNAYSIDIIARVKTHSATAYYEVGRQFNGH